MVGPERRHPGPGHDGRRRLQPVEHPVGLQAIAGHPQVRRQVRRRLILRNRAEHVALLALQQLEQLLAPADVLPADAVRTISCVWNGPIVFETAPK